MKHLLILIVFIGIAFSIDAQTNTPILERKVTVKIVNQPLGKTLNILSETAKFSFSYSNQIIKVSKVVSVYADNRSIKDILDQLFGGDITYQQIGNHLVLQKKIQAKQTSKINTDKVQSRYDFIVSGYIRDVESGDGLTEVSVYNKTSLANTLSGDFGYYKINFSSKTPEVTITIRKEQYRDTSIQIKYANNGVIESFINLTPIVSKIDIEEDEEPVKGQIVIVSDSVQPLVIDTTKTMVLDTAKPLLKDKIKLVWFDSLKKIKVEDTKLGQLILGAYNGAIARNIRDSFERDWQVTFVPPLGSNGSLSGLVTNKVSFNTLVGYNGGVNGVEFGGLLNFVRRDVEGAQFAGLCNIVGGSMTGAQFAGLFNNNINYVRGFQAAGIYNYNNEGAEGVQAAGILNINRGTMDGVQLAGIGNYAGSNTSAVQVAGIINLANDIDGGQIAGIVNIARKVRGFQIGLINIADTCDGVAIGLINFIKNGIHQLEVSNNDLNQYGLAYRSGSGRFYSSVSANLRMPYNRDSLSLFGYGFGIGVRAKLSKVFYWNTEIGSKHLMVDFRSNHLNMQNHLSTGIEIQFFKGFSIFGNATINHSINDSTDPNWDTVFSKLVSNPYWSDNGRYQQKAWFGWQAGVRIF